MPETSGRERLIVALDVPTEAAALALIEQLGDAVSFYKIGLELFTSAGMPLVRKVRAMGKNVFLDLKLFDIGETVRRTVAVIAREDVTFLTVQGDAPVVRAAVEGKGSSALKILAVTVLTSLNDADLKDIGYSGTVSELVQHRAAHAIAAGCDGLIASAHEAAPIKAAAPRDVLVITPGIRPAGSATNDQKRVATPASALASGADYLVVGRPITSAADPRAAALSIAEEISGTAFRI